MPGPTLSQDAEELNLSWVEGDPVSLAFNVADIDWSGGYILQIRARANPAASPLLMDLIVTANYVAPDTEFLLASTAVLNTLGPGKYKYDMQQVNGLTRLRGTVIVVAQVSV